MLKCSRCRHIFPAERTQRDVEEDTFEDVAAEASPILPVAAPPAPTKPRQGDLDLNFDEGSSWEGEQAELPSFRDDDDYSLGTSQQRGAPREGRRGPRLLSDFEGEGEDAEMTLGHGARRGDESTAYSFDEDALTGKPTAIEEDAEEDAADGDEERDESDDSDHAVPARDGDVKRSGRWLVPLGLFFSIIVGVYFFLAQELIRDREFAEEFIARLPMVGSSLAADRLLFRKVALTEVDGGFVRVKQGKEVFVISGTALNTASRPLRNIRIEGSLTDAMGRPLQQEAITCGGMDARRLLQGLSLREVEMLGQVEPSRKFRLEPGDSTTFAIVFTNPPPTAAEFTARVASAQR